MFGGGDEVSEGVGFHEEPRFLLMRETRSQRPGCGEGAARVGRFITQLHILLSCLQACWAAFLYEDVQFDTLEID